MTNRTFSAGLIGLAALTLSACQSPYASTTHEPGIQPPTPNFPARAEANPPAPAAAASAPATSVVRSEPLPPPAEPPVVVAERAQPAPGPIVTQSLPPPAPVAERSSPPPAPYTPAPAPAPVMETRMITTGPIVDVDGPSAESHTVKAGETLYSISKSLGLTVKQAAEINGLKEPYTLKPGQRIKGKPSRGKAYVVQSGDTLSAIGRRFSVSASQLASANDKDTGSAIRPGQKLILPKGYRDLGAQQITVAATSVPAAPAPMAQPPARPIPASNTAAAAPTPPPAQRPQAPQASVLAANPPPAPRPSVQPIIPSARPSTAAEIQTAGQGKFIWPISGRQLNGFGPRGANQLSNGLNLAASSGTPVKAAGPGTVMYAGSEVQGFGNLVLLQHENGFVSVYAHLSKINVAMRQAVRQGQEIGEVGQSGGVGEPQLYFEMRHQPTARDEHKPFDPTLVLPAR